MLDAARDLEGKPQQIELPILPCRRRSRDRGALVVDRRHRSNPVELSLRHFRDALFDRGEKWRGLGRGEAKAAQYGVQMREGALHAEKLERCALN